MKKWDSPKQIKGQTCDSPGMMLRDCHAFEATPGLRQVASLTNFGFGSATFSWSASTMDFWAKRSQAKARTMKLKIRGPPKFQQNSTNWLSCGGLKPCGLARQMPRWYGHSSPQSIAQKRARHASWQEGQPLNSQKWGVGLGGPYCSHGPWPWRHALEHPYVWQAQWRGSTNLCWPQLLKQSVETSSWQEKQTSGLRYWRYCNRMQRPGGR